jgi:hypothetical protein
MTYTYNLDTQAVEAYWFNAKLVCCLQHMHKLRAKEKKKEKKE